MRSLVLPWWKRKKFNGYTIGLTILFALLTLLAYPALMKTFVNNMGWVYLIRSYPTFLDAPTGERAEEWFARGTNKDAQYWLGYGAAAVQLRQMEVAWQRWQLGGVPYQTLDAIGAAHALHLGDWQSAINYKVGADLQANSVGAPEIYLGKICQSVRTNTLATFGEYAEYCNAFARQNQANLLVNGNFESEGMAGWSIFPHPKFTDLQMTEDFPSEHSEPTTKLVFSADYSAPVQICQRIPLAAGETVQFTGEIKFDLAASSSAQLLPLYIGWQQDKKPQGNAAQPILDSDWNAYSRTFQLPKDAESDVLFCPIVVTGGAVVWLANIQVLTIPGNDEHK